MTGLRLKSIRFKDGLGEAFSNLRFGGPLTQLGGGMQHHLFNSSMALNAYLSSGMMRKVITLPADDRVREWRDWQADADQITLIEAEEKRLGLKAKVQQAETLRGIGGGALIIITAGDHASSLSAAQISKGGIVAINVVSRWQITAKDWNTDLASPEYGNPTMWQMSSNGGAQQNIHPSRVICFRGAPLPAGYSISSEEAFWGDSRLQQIYNEVMRSDNAQAWFSELIRKAKLLRYGVSDMTGYSQEELDKRIGLIATGESILNATIYNLPDKEGSGGEKIDDYQVSWAGMPNMMDAFDQRIGAVSGIPFTILFSRSPAGMNATGQHDRDNWNRTVKAGQEMETRPCLELLDPLLLRSAGVDASGIWWEWSPLEVPTEKEQIEAFKAFMEAFEKLLLTGLIPSEAAAEALQNTIVERGWVPGLEGALAKIPENLRFGVVPEAPMGEGDGGDDDPSALQATGGGDPDLAGDGGSGSGAARRADA